MSVYGIQWHSGFATLNLFSNGAVIDCFMAAASTKPL